MSNRQEVEHCAGGRRLQLNINNLVTMEMEQCRLSSKWLNFQNWVGDSNVTAVMYINHPPVVVVVVVGKRHVEFSLSSERSLI